MSAQRGKALLLKLESAPCVFTTVAGLRARTISLNARTVDATDGDSAGRWRELLGGAGVNSAAVAGQGISRDAATDAQQGAEANGPAKAPLARPKMEPLAARSDQKGKRRASSPP